MCVVAINGSKAVQVFCKVDITFTTREKHDARQFGINIGVQTSRLQFVIVRKDYQKAHETKKKFGDTGECRSKPFSCVEDFVEFLYATFSGLGFPTRSTKFPLKAMPVQVLFPTPSICGHVPYTMLSAQGST